MFTHWNVHQAEAGNAERLLNDHADKGYELRFIRNVYGGNKVQVVFCQHFETIESRDAFRAEKVNRRAARQQSQPVAQDTEPAIA